MAKQRVNHRKLCVISLFSHDGAATVVIIISSSGVLIISPGVDVEGEVDVLGEAVVAHHLLVLQPPPRGGDQLHRADRLTQLEYDGYQHQPSLLVTHLYGEPLLDLQDAGEGHHLQPGVLGEESHWSAVQQHCHHHGVLLHHLRSHPGVLYHLVINSHSSGLILLLGVGGAAVVVLLGIERLGGLLAPGSRI